MQLNSSGRRTQRGVGALAVSMLLLFASSIVVFYLNRGLIFEQKTSANQARATSAFEMAEAGIEWATGMLNGQVDIDANCNFLSTAVSSFRRIYIQAGWPGNTNVQAAANVFPGCKVDGTTLTCGCPAAGAGVASLGSNVLPSFSVAFAAVAGDPTAVRVTSTGCTAQAATCAPATTGNSDANARVEVILKLNPTLRAAPSAALTCGTSCQVGGAYDIRNLEVSSNGYLVNAGTTISSGNGTGYQTIPGQPVTNALIAQDTSLSSLSSSDPTCSNSAMFQAYFGTTLAAYAAGPDVKTIPGCDNPSVCGGLMLAAYNDGWRNFYFPDGFALNNSAPFSVLGANAPGQGVNLVTPAGIDINGNITINGLLFSNSANFNDLGTGTADINGAIISCAAYRNNGNGLLNYSSAALGGTGLRPGLMIRVPGSWRDFQ
jgi:hypothetical protein